jgi:tRNA(adenine34) deaminase
VTGEPVTGYEASFEPTMRAALAEAVAAVATGDVPVGAIVIDDAGTIVGRGRNRREADGDPTAHAEIVALRDAARTVGGWRLDGLTLVVTLEPCTMCAGAITAARLGRLVYGAADPRAGAVGSLWDVVRDQRLTPRPEVIGGVLADECQQAIATFFADRRLASSRCCRESQVSSAAVESPSGRGRTPRKRVRGQPLRGFKSHLHRTDTRIFPGSAAA